MAKINQMEKGLEPFKDGVLYAQLLRRIDINKKSIEYSLQIMNQGSLNPRQLKSLINSTEDKRLEVEEAYETCKELHCKYHWKNPALLGQEAETLDRKVEEFNESYKKINNRIKNLK